MATITLDMERAAAERARIRVNSARWNLDVAVFLFGILIIIVIMLFQGIGVEIVAPVAVFGLGVIWLFGWRNGRHLYSRFYNEELEQESREANTKVVTDESIDAMVQKAIRARWE